MIRGTTHDQDAMFCDKTKKMLEKSQWPDKYDIKIDLAKVSLSHLDWSLARQSMDLKASHKIIRRGGWYNKRNYPQPYRLECIKRIKT